MSEDRWIGTTSDGRSVEYCYNQSEAGAFAIRTIEGGLGETRSPLPRGLSRDQVEKEFERPTDDAIVDRTSEP